MKRLFLGFQLMFESILTPQGAQYIMLEKIELTGKL